MICVQCGRIFENSRQYVYQGGWRHKPQCRAWKQCEARLGHTYDKYLTLIACTREECPSKESYSHQELRHAQANT